MRVVMVTGELPIDNPHHAGGVYVQHVHRLLASNSRLTVISPDSPSNREASTHSGVPDCLLLSEVPRAKTLTNRATNRALDLADRAVRGTLIGVPSYPIVRALLQDSPERSAVAAADAIDLQWSEAIRLAPLVRRINPRALLIGTFHDVQSQVVERLSEREHLRAARLNRWQLIRAETNARRRLHTTLVFSEKDQTLLGSDPSIQVVHPPLAVGHASQHRPDGPATVLMVSALNRPENQEAAEWLLREIWPRVHREHPQARLRLVGSGAPDTLLEQARTTRGAFATGYVDDLAAEYGGAQVVIVPVLRGAGVKFKTIEAMVRAVPVVATTVGAEGIGTPAEYAAVSDDPSVLSAAVSAVLTDPVAAQDRADRVQRWARVEFGYEQFKDRLQAAYRSSGWIEPARPQET